MPEMPIGPKRAEYERLLNGVIDTAHQLIMKTQKTGAIPDDRKIHNLVRELLVEFGPKADE